MVDYCPCCGRKEEEDLIRIPFGRQHLIGMPHADNRKQLLELGSQKKSFAIKNVVLGRYDYVCMDTEEIDDLIRALKELKQKLKEKI